MATKLKFATTIREYKTKAFGWDIVVPVGSSVSNNTAMGPDDNYRFWDGFEKEIQKLTGFANSPLAHDLAHYGLNIPAEYCEPWRE